MEAYIVKAGDTLSAIAKKYGTTVEALVASNGIQNKNFIYIGQVIKIPDAAGGDITTEMSNALKACLEAIVRLPEYKALEKMLNG